MKLQTAHSDDALIVTVGAARIDAAVAIRFKDAMRAVTEGTTGQVILDLSQVDFVDSSGLGAIIAAMKQLGEASRLELAALNPNVAKVFRLTRMDGIFTIHAAVPGGPAHAAG